MSHPVITGAATIVSTVAAGSLSFVKSIVHLPLTGGFATGHGWPAYDIRVWTAKGVLEATLEGHTGTVLTLAVQGCGGLVSGSWDYTARVWSGTACVAVLRGHTARVVAAAVHPSNDNIVVTGSQDRTVRVWDVASATCTAVLEGHTFGVTALAFLSDGSIVSGSMDRTVRVWSPDGSCKSVLEQPNEVRCLTVLPDDTFIVGGGYFFSTCFVRKWAGDAEQWTITTDSVVESVTPEAFRLSSCQVVFFDAADGRETGTLKPAFNMAGMPGGKVMVHHANRKQVFVVRVHRASRVQAIRVMKAAWGAHGGVPPPRHDDGPGTPLAALTRALCLRRLCRIRGMDSEDMESEIVEPFARDIVRFL